jgi:hypothetical protein
MALGEGSPYLGHSAGRQAAVVPRGTRAAAGQTHPRRQVPAEAEDEVKGAAKENLGKATEGNQCLHTRAPGNGLPVPGPFRSCVED